MLFYKHAEKRNLCPKSLHSNGKLLHTFSCAIFSCGNTPFIACLKYLSWYYSCDYHRVGRLLWQQQEPSGGAPQRRGARSELPASCTWHWDLCSEKLWTDRETMWEVGEGRRRSHVFHTDCTSLINRGEENASEIQNWKNIWIQLRTRHGIKTRFISLVFSFFFQVEGFSRSLPYFKLNIAFECDWHQCFVRLKKRGITKISQSLTFW